jgi:RHS repeat-associated protein
MRCWLRALVWVWCGVWAFTGAAWAQTGVSEDRVSLPEGPGSLEGLGEDVSINPNMGTMSYQLPIPTPQGYAEMTPGVSLQYSSGGGAGLAGVGWDLPVPSIERMTSRGLPVYTDADLFAANGGAQLVQVSAGEPAVYRARVEGGFVRYLWHRRGRGDGGYWIAELPDGKIEAYGATAEGEEIEAARVGGEEGVFRYHLVERVDPWGHKIRYRYQKFGTAAAPVEIGYVFVGERARFRVALGYEARPDLLSDLKGGFPELLEARLSEVRVLAGEVEIGRWALRYEPEAAAGGLSRLVEVARFGLTGEAYPAVFRFGWSRSLGARCQESDCGGPALVELGQGLGFNFQSGNVTLVDINGDALPDVLETPVGAPHRFYLNRVTPTGQRLEGAVESAVGDSTTHLLRAGQVQVLDVNGDGLADLLNTRTGVVLENEGGGDWARQARLFEVDGRLPDLGLDLDPEDGELMSIRFFDYDNDKRVDLLRSVGQGDSNQTSLWRNLPGGGFAPVEDAEPLGVGFESNNLHMSDMNGDGLLDLLLVELEGLRYRLSRGRGRWSGWVEVEAPFSATQLSQAELEDLNNDGLTDLVLVQADEVRYALNIGGAGFGEAVVVDAGVLGRGLPERDNTTTVLYADMNGNGSSDVVWSTAGGDVTYLELFTVQPNLLSRIENSLGYVQEVSYRSSVLEAAQDAQEGRAWAYKLPHAATLVSEVVTVEGASGQREVSRYRYHDGRYDGGEKQFRGFAWVDVFAPGDETSEASRKTIQYDLGWAGPHRAGLELEVSHRGDGERLLRIERKVWEDCPLEGVPEGLAWPIRWACQAQVETVAVEGNDARFWATVRSQFGYDGFGNLTQERLLGLTGIGGGGCEPCGGRGEEVQGSACGPQCLGDEQYRETEYLHPERAGGRWLLRAPLRARSYGRPGSARVAERTFYYDGAAFEGLPEGEVTRGAVTRVTQRINGEGEVLQSLRFARDEHGNVTEELTPNGDPSRPEEHRRAIGWDAVGLNPVSLEQFLVDERGEPYRLRQEMSYDELWNQPGTITDQVVVRGGVAQGAFQTESVVYDNFGRYRERYYLGDQEPSERIDYVLQAPVSHAVFWTRTQKGRGALDRRSVRCFDSQGRKIQERVELEEGRWLVNAYTQYNPNGSEHRVYTSHVSGSGDCAQAPPAGTGYREVSYDALGRVVRNAWVTREGVAVERFVHGPTSALHFDLEDNDPSSPHHETPTRYDYDGLGRTVGIARFTSPVEAEALTLTYDELNHFRGTVDAAGNEKIQAWDDAGRLIAIDDPDRGQIALTLNANGEAIREVDGAGRAVGRRYDGLGRLVARWEEADPAGTLMENLYDFPRGCPAERCGRGATRLVELRFPGGQERFGYNERQQMTYHAVEVRGQEFEFSFEYDNLDRVTERSYPDGTRLSFVWDSLRLVSIPGVVEFGYGDNGLLSELRYANGVHETRLYDDRLRLRDQAVAGPADDLLMTRGYRYDKVGKLVEVLDDSAQAGMGSAEARYRYDNLGRLVEAHLDPGREGFDELIRVGYDRQDNITSQRSSLGAASAAEVGEYVYAGAQPHAVTRAGGLELAYNGAGEMIRRGDRRLEWDAFGRLTRVRRGDEELARYTYGAGGRWLLKESGGETVWSLTEDFEIRDGVSAVLINDGPRRLARLESGALSARVLSDLAPDGEITAGDAWRSWAGEAGVVAPTPGADGPEALLDAALARLLRGEGATYYHCDLAGVAMSTDAAGRVEGRAVYYPFGLERDREGGVGPQGYGVKAQAEELGTLDYGARHLDPWLGRWLSPDPAFRSLESPDIQHVAEEVGAYVAMGNHPTSARDSDGQVLGLLTNAVDHVAGAVIGGVVGFVAGAVESYQSVRALDYSVSVSLASGLVGGLAGFVRGGATGALSGLVGAAADLVTLGASELAHGASRGGGLSRQQQVTNRRLAGAAATFAVGVGLGVATVLTGGIALGVVGLVGAAAVLGVKLWAIKKAHNNGFSKALFRTAGVNDLTRKLGTPPEQIFAPGELAQLRGGQDIKGRGEITFSVNADGDLSVARGRSAAPSFRPRPGLVERVRGGAGRGQRP